MGFFEAITSVFNKYATFSGRAPRSEFWWFWLFNMIVSIAIDGSGMRHGMNGLEHMEGPSILSTIWHLGVFIPTLAVSVRRLHDTDRSGWWLLLWLIPVIGWIVLVVFYASRGTAGANRFGPDPLAGGTDGGSDGYGPSSIPPVSRR